MTRFLNRKALYVVAFAVLGIAHADFVCTLAI